jgi:hypothetical protein
LSSICSETKETIFAAFHTLSSEFKSFDTFCFNVEKQNFFSDTIHAGANFMLMCAQIASKIDQEQNKTLWVSSGTIW